MNSTVIWIIVFVAGGVAYFIYQWYQTSLLEPIEQEFDGFTRTGNGTILEGTHNDHPVEIEYKVGTKHDRDAVNIEVGPGNKSLPTVDFRGETAWHRFLEFIGWTDEVEIGYSGFDDAVHVDTSDDDSVEEWLSNPEVTEAVESLLEPSRTSLHSEGQSLKYYINSSINWRTYLKPDRVRKSLDQLVFLIDEAP